MADYDSIDISGGDAQCFVGGGSYAASTTHNLSNVSFWEASTQCTYSYDTGDFNAPINVVIGKTYRVPKGANTLTLSPASAISYMRKVKGS